MGAFDDQDVRAPAVRRAGHPQRPRARRLPGPGGRDRVHQGGQLLYSYCGSAAPGPGRRCLAAPSGYRAPGPGLRPVDLLSVPVLRPGLRRAAAQRVLLRLFGLPGRIQPQPAVSLRRADAGPVRADPGPDPVPAGHAGCADPVRPQDAAPLEPGRRAAGAGHRDRETAVRPQLVPDPFRAAAAEGLHQGRTRAPLRGHRAGHAAVRSGPRAHGASGQRDYLYRACSPRI